MSTTKEEMSRVSKVPDLLDRAFEVFYNDLLCKATQNTVESVRKWIDQQLPMGSMNKKIRYNSFLFIIFYIQHYQFLTHFVYSERKFFLTD